MKRIIIILLVTTAFSGVSGQEVVDYLLKGRALIGIGKNDEAISILSQQADLRPDYRIYIERATAYRNKSDFESAIADLQRANNIENNSGSYGLAQVFALKRDPVSSLQYLSNNLNSKFKIEEKVIMLDPAFRLIENTPEWRVFWRTERYTAIERGLAEIEYELSVGHITEADDILVRLTGEATSGPGLQYIKALIAFSKKNYSDALTILSGLNSSDKNEKMLRLLAKVQSELGNNTEAAFIYSELINNEIVDSELLYLRAESYRNAGEEEKALSDINKYLDLNPENAKGLSLAGKLELLNGDNIKALEYFTKNINFNPSNPENYIERADSYFNSGSWKYAIEDYGMALDLQPESPEVYLNKGIALINLGKADDACHDLRQALKLGNKQASQYISKYCIK